MCWFLMLQMSPTLKDTGLFACSCLLGADEGRVEDELDYNMLRQVKISLIRGQYSGKLNYRNTMISIILKDFWVIIIQYKAKHMAYSFKYELKNKTDG